MIMESKETSGWCCEVGVAGGRDGRVRGHWMTCLVSWLRGSLVGASPSVLCGSLGGE